MPESSKQPVLRRAESVSGEERFCILWAVAAPACVFAEQDVLYAESSNKDVGDDVISKPVVVVDGDKYVKVPVQLWVNQTRFNQQAHQLCDQYNRLIEQLKHLHGEHTQMRCDYVNLTENLKQLRQLHDQLNELHTKLTEQHANEHTQVKHMCTNTKTLLNNLVYHTELIMVHDNFYTSALIALDEEEDVDKLKKQVKRWKDDIQKNLWWRRSQAIQQLQLMKQVEAGIDACKQYVSSSGGGGATEICTE